MKRGSAVVLGLLSAGCSAQRSGADASADAPALDALAEAALEASADASSERPVCPSAPPQQPQARGDAVGAVDPVTGRLFVFGGDVGPTVQCIPSPMFRADTWRYDAECDQWQQLSPATSPSARSRAASALDPRRRRLLLFGGRYRAASSGNYTLYADVWALDLATGEWSQLTPANAGPSARANAVAAYDPSSDALLVHGGNTSASGASFTPQSDLWALDLGALTWRRLSPTGGGPSARLFHAAAVVGGSLWVSGGGGANAFQGPFFTDLWRLDLGTSAWSRLFAQNDAVAGRINHALVPDGDGAVLLAGHDDGALGNRNDALGVDPTGAVSTHVAGDQLDQQPAGFCDFPANFVTPQADTPERRSAAVVAADPARRRVLVYGGKTDCGLASDVWLFDLASHAWRVSRGTADGMSCARQDRSNCSTLCN